MKRKVKFQRFWILIIVYVLILSGICWTIAAAALQPTNSCPDDLAEEEYSDEMDYVFSDEANESAHIDEMTAKYCEWAAEGNCFTYDPEECSKYGVFFPGTYLTSNISYILRDDKPGILILIGSWEHEGNTTKPVPNTDINFRIYKKDPFNVLMHKIFNTGEDGQAFFEWIWGNTKVNWNNDWIVEYSHGNFTDEKSFYSEVNDTKNFTDETTILTEYPDTPLYQ